MFTNFCIGIAYGVAMGVGIWILIDSNNQINQLAHLWWWTCGVVILSLTGIINCFLVPFLLFHWNEQTRERLRGGSIHIYDYRNPLDSFQSLAILGMFIWACIIYNDILSKHIDYNNHMWVYFVVLFWSIVATYFILVVIGMILCFGYCSTIGILPLSRNEVNLYLPFEVL